MAVDKSEATRRRLLEAAGQTFAKQGYDGASVNDIARAAGLTKGAIYWNFASKEELFLALVRQRQSALVGEFFSAADAASADDADRDAYVTSLADVYRRQAPDPDEWKLWMEFVLFGLRKPSLTRRIRKEGEQSFRALVEQLEQRSVAEPGTPPLSAAVLARLYVAIFDGVNQQRAIDPASVDDELFPTLIQFVEEAIRALTR